MKEGCRYIDTNGLTCEECAERYQMPYDQCCLIECGENEFC